MAFNNDSTFTSSFPEFVPSYSYRAGEIINSPCYDVNNSKVSISESEYSDKFMSPSSLRNLSTSTSSLDEVVHGFGNLALRSSDSKGLEKYFGESCAWGSKPHDNGIIDKEMDCPSSTRNDNAFKHYDGMLSFESRRFIGSDFYLAQVIQEDEGPKRLHVSNIPFRFREFDLYKLFGKYGTVTDAEIIYNDKGSKGFGFVTMSKGKEADFARLLLDGWSIGGRVIEVNLATPKITPGKRPSVPGVSVSRPSDAIVNSSSLIELPIGDHSSYDMLVAQTKLAQAQVEVLKLRQRSMRKYFDQVSSEDAARMFSGSDKRS